ncbi:hypothetical protein WOC76_13350 [Methylocystis sp. IM3]|uniref:hypothetical protein n=1 Tax=unclassified Methylocystis TaxID=2625913 RepID=UPI0030FCF9DB
MRRLTLALKRALIARASIAASPSRPNAGACGGVRGRFCSTKCQVAALPRNFALLLLRLALAELVRNMSNDRPDS